MRKYLIITAALFSVCAILLLLPGFSSGRQPYAGHKVKAKILSVDNTSLYSSGLITQGDQYCELEIAQGKLKGQTIRGVNRLFGSLELDKTFEAGDSALIVLDLNTSG